MSLNITKTSSIAELIKVTADLAKKHGKECTVHAADAPLHLECGHMISDKKGRNLEWVTMPAKSAKGHPFYDAFFESDQSRIALAQFISELASV